MGFEQRQDFARQVADLNKYGQALNQCETVDEVVSLTLEAITILFELTDGTIVEARDGDLRVVGSTNPELSSGTAPGEAGREAYETGETVHLRIDPSIPEGRFHPRFNGHTGEVVGQQGAAFRVRIDDGGKEKTLIARAAHLQRQTQE